MQRQHHHHSILFLLLLFLLCCNVSKSNKNFIRIPIKKRLYNNIKLQNYGSVQYIGNVGFGSHPSQQLSVVFDTGSSDIWIPDINCTACGTTHKRYNASASSTSLTTSSSKVFSDQYGSGVVSGNVISDTIRLNNIILRNMSFGTVLSEGLTLQLFTADGILGLAFDGPLSSVSNPGLISAFKSQYPTLNHTFAFYLTSTPYADGSELHIGGTFNSDSSNWYFTPVVSLPGFTLPTYWTIHLNSFTISSNDGDACRPFCYAIIDTGTSLIGIPDSQFNSVVSLASPCNKIKCEASTLSDYPVLTLGISSGLFKLYPEDYVHCHKDDDDLHSCEMLLQNAGSQSWWIIGDVFIRKYYTVFDADMMQVGFSCNHHHCKTKQDQVSLSSSTTSSHAHSYSKSAAAFLITFVAFAAVISYVFLSSEEEKNSIITISSYNDAKRNYDSLP